MEKNKETEQLLRAVQQAEGFDSQASMLLLQADHEKYFAVKNGRLDHLVYGLISAMKCDEVIFDVIMAAVKGFQQSADCTDCQASNSCANQNQLN